MKRTILALVAGLISVLVCEPFASGQSCLDMTQGASPIKPPTKYPISYSGGGSVYSEIFGDSHVWKGSLTLVGPGSVPGTMSYKCSFECLWKYPGGSVQLGGWIDTSDGTRFFNGQVKDLPLGDWTVNMVVFHGIGNPFQSWGYLTVTDATEAEASFDIKCPGWYDLHLNYGGGGVISEAVYLSSGLARFVRPIHRTKDGVQYTLSNFELWSPCPTKSPGDNNLGLKSVHLALSLGHGVGGSSAGELRLDSETIDPIHYAPASLVAVAPEGGAMDLVYAGGGILRQIKAPQTFVDIITLSATSYEAQFYYPSQLGAKDATTGLYSISGAPFVKYRIENPDATDQWPVARLRITEIRGSLTKVNLYVYDLNGPKWTLSQADGLRVLSETEAIVNGDRVKTTTVSNDAAVVVSEVSRTYHAFPWGTELVREVLDPHGVPRETLYEFYDVSPTDPNFGRLKQRTNFDGAWTRFVYDAAGHTLKSIRPFLNALPDTTDEAQCVVTQKTYDTIADADGDGLSEDRETEIEFTLGHETSRRYRINWSKAVTLAGDSFSRRSEIVCTVAGAAWNATTNLTTETLQYTTGFFARLQRRVIRPDGTATVATYSMDGNGQQTTMIKTGRPNAGLDDVIDGRRTLSFTSPTGQITSETITDIASGLELSGWTATAFDPVNRPTRFDYSDGTYALRTYACCGLASERDRSGLVTSYTYDALGRQITATRSGITTSTTYDADGRIKSVTRLGTDASAMMQETNGYDLAGRLTSRKDALNRETTYAETYDSGTGHLTRTTTNPAAATTIEVFARDGSRLSVSGTATAPHTYAYGVDADGLFTKDTAIGADAGGQPTTTEWTKTSTDFAGRAFKTTYADGATAQSLYNSVGQLVRQVDPDGVTVLFAYNARGEQEVTAIDLNANATIDYAGTDRVTKTTTTVATKTAGATYTVQRTTTQIWETLNADTPVTVSIAEQSTDGLHSWQTVRGLTTTAVTAYDGSGGRTVTTTAPDGVQTVQVFAGEQLASNTVTTAAAVPLGGATYTYDAHHRLQSVTDARNGTTTFTYYGDDQIQSVTTPDPDTTRAGTGYDPQTTSYVYDAAGRVQTVTQPEGGVVNTSYYPTGAVKRTWGARTYPVEYAYDPQGRVKTLTTWQNFAGDSGQAITTWNYDAQRGFLLNKRYADSTGPAYTYKPSGRLLTRTWARTPVITTTYTYNAAGDLTGTDYSDATPDVTVTYDRTGRPLTVADASGTRSHGYHASGQLETESYTSGVLSGLAVNRSFDSLYRLSGLTVPSVTSATFAYDAASRLQTVTKGTNTATYAYAANSALVESIVFANGGTTPLTTTKSYDKLNRLASIVNTPSVATALSHAYTYNAANQRTRATREDNAYWSYAYDPLGQVTTGSKYLANDTAALGLDFGYSYDDIGNRKTATTNAQVSTYVPNALNQYTQRTVPGAIDVLGAASPTATVTVALDTGTPQATTRQGESFYKQFTVDNSSTAQFPTVKITGVKNLVGPSGEDAVTEITKSTHLAKTPELFAHDLDGNLIDDARWHYTWDGENRLIAIETSTLAAGAGVPKQKLEFGYDAQGRRFQKKVYAWNTGTSTWTLSSELRFIYDGWNLLADLNGQASNAVVCTYTWGLDLSGSSQGAGGVAGLLFSTLGGQATNYAYTYDGNGNVSALVDLATGLKAATYDYNAFGETASVEGSFATANAFRFSSKYTDEETGQIYYGFRYYIPQTGRWLSADSIQEQGGVNLYGFVSNHPTIDVDILGEAGLGEPTFGRSENEGSLAGRMLTHYIGRSGTLFKLSFADVLSLNFKPTLDVLSHDGVINRLLKVVQTKTPETITEQDSALGYYYTTSRAGNNALGAFVIRIKGTIECDCANKKDEYTFKGSFRVEDRYDFDNYWVSHRSFIGNIKTALPHFLVPGVNFDVQSDWLHVEQVLQPHKTAKW